MEREGDTGDSRYFQQVLSVCVGSVDQFADGIGGFQFGPAAVRLKIALTADCFISLFC